MADSRGSADIIASPSSSTLTASPLSPAAARHRPGYARLPSVSENDNAHRHFADEGVTERDIGEARDGLAFGQGLGLGGEARRVTGRRLSGRPFIRGPMGNSTYSPFPNSANTSFSTVIGTPSSSFAENEDDAQAFDKALPTESSTNIDSNRPYVAFRDDERLLRQSNLSSRSYAGTIQDTRSWSLTDAHQISLLGRRVRHISLFTYPGLAGFG